MQYQGKNILRFTATKDTITKINALVLIFTNPLKKQRANKSNVIVIEF